jgi:hypothetical protein
MTAVGANDYVGANREHAVRRFGAKADNAPAFLNQIGGLSLHPQIKTFVALAALGTLVHRCDDFIER